LDLGSGGASRHFVVNKTSVYNKKQKPKTKKQKPKTYLKMRYFWKKCCKTAAVLRTLPLIGAKVEGRGGSCLPGIFSHFSNFSATKAN